LASEPRDRTGRMYHISLTKKDVGRVAFLPGDPGRVPLIAEHFREAKQVASHREYCTYGGYLGDEHVIAISTGIGGPSAAIAIEELARLGVEVMIRVGTCGAIRREAKVGSSVIADAAVALDGTSLQYALRGYPAAATPGVVMALEDSATSLRKKHIVGLSASTDSFYVGQGRKGYRGYFPSWQTSLVADLAQANVLCFEMESSTLFTLGRIYGLKTGALFAVVANRATDEFRQDAGLDDTIAIAVNSIKRLKKYGV
jgi:uridine phosphorylase